MSGRRLPSQLFAFCLLCCCWGSTFVPLKEGLAGLPPLLFAGLRFTLAAGVFAAVLASRPRGQPLPRTHLMRILSSSLLVITLNYGLLFWGAQFLPSGLSGLVSFGGVALSLTFLSFLGRLETVTLPKVLGLGFGALGLALLATAKLNVSPEQFGGVIAIFLGSVAYAVGSFLVRPTLELYGALRVTTLQMAAGGGALSLLSLATESSGLTSLGALRQPATLLSLLYLVAVGSLLGFWLYNRLLTTWEVSTLALYNFVSPCIALLLGALVYGEALSWLEGVAATCLLGGVLVRYLDRVTKADGEATKEVKTVVHHE